MCLKYLVKNSLGVAKLGSMCIKRVIIFRDLKYAKRMIAKLMMPNVPSLIKVKAKFKTMQMHVLTLVSN